MRGLRSLRRAARDGTAGACRGKQSGIADLNPSHIMPRRRMAQDWAMEYGTDQRGRPAGGCQNPTMCHGKSDVYLRLRRRRRRTGHVRHRRRLCSAAVIGGGRRLGRVGDWRHWGIDITDLRDRLLLLLGNLLQQPSSARSSCAPDLAALLAEGRRFCHEGDWHQYLRIENGPHQRRVLTDCPLAASLADTP